jgi:UDP-N-acetylglucosamine--N-acetylmuramyl-(pentapeptide) pyrophosphoryl-undecaprenol N-acetylglucosamine transferase
MRIVLTAGGSGGHITPILAVARELKTIKPDIELIYIGQRGDQLSDIPKQSEFIDKVYVVRAGKFRRYHGEGLKQLLDLSTVAKNIRDTWWVLIGIIQSYLLLRKLKPDIIFTRGGFVSVPVAIAGRFCGIPYITHDSDAVPSLANRIIAKKALLNTVALPKEVYKYAQYKTVTVGVPVQKEFKFVTPEQKKLYKEQINLTDADKIIFVTGGGNGAQTLNDVIIKISPALFDIYPKLALVHMAGRMHEAVVRKMYETLLDANRNKRVIVKGFISELYEYSGAADVVITRAGATTLAEFAIQQKPCIVVPSPFLTGGHQLRNAEYLETQNAVVCVTEEQLQDNSEALMSAIRQILDDPDEANSLAKRLSEFAYPDSAKKLAMLLLEQVKT